MERWRDTSREIEIHRERERDTYIEREREIGRDIDRDRTLGPRPYARTPQQATIMLGVFFGS